MMKNLFFRILEICVLTVSGHQVPERQRWSRDLTMGFGPYPLFNLIFLIKITPNHGFSNGRRTIRSFKKCNLTAPGDHQVTKLSKSLAPFLQRGLVGIFSGGSWDHNESIWTLKPLPPSSSRNL